MKHLSSASLSIVLALAAIGVRAEDKTKKPPKPAPPGDLAAHDHPWSENGSVRVLKGTGFSGDGGEKVDLFWTLSPDDVELDDEKVEEGESKRVVRYKIFRSAEEGGKFKKIAEAEPGKKDYDGDRRMKHTVEKCKRGQTYFFRVVAVGPEDVESEFVQAGPVIPVRQLFDAGRFWIAVFAFVLCGAVIYWIRHARQGKPLKVRKIAGLEAVDEAVGRATEMGRSCMFIIGTQDMNDIQTIAGMTILSHVATTAAEYDAKIEVPTMRSLVMTAARETVQTAFLSAGRPDAYNEDAIYYVTDEQFGYVAHVTGKMVRDKPAACFYMGAFFAEALILAETGNAVGAIQVAGTAMPAQLPFFVAACDYTLIGEEFFAASAYLSGEPEQLGSLKGQDVGKLVGAVLLVAGCGVATLATVTGSAFFGGTLDFLKDTVLQ